MPLDRIAGNLFQRTSSAQRAAFLACFVSGYLVHLFAFTNIIPNSDGLSRVFDPQQMTVSGRWFLHYASALNSFTQMPALIGFFSMVFLALAAAGIVSVLGMRSRSLAALLGVSMAAFPLPPLPIVWPFSWLCWRWRWRKRVGDGLWQEACCWPCPWASTRPTPPWRWPCRCC